MRKLLILLLCTLLVNCASTTKEPEIRFDDGLATDSTQKPAPAKAPEPPKRSTGSPDDLLNEALKRQNDAEILKAAQSVLLVNPNHAKALNAISLVYYKQGKYRAANYFNRLAIKENPKVAGLYNNAGLISLALNDQREAITSFKEGYKIDSSDAAIGANLGALYIANKDYKNAEIALQSAMRRNSKDAKVLNNYAIALSANKKFDQATRVYERAIKESSNSQDIMLNYSIHLIENLKRYQQGLELLDRLKFVGEPQGSRNLIKDLENKAKAGLK